MFTAYVIVTLVAAAANTYAAYADVVRPQWLVTNMDELSVPASWALPLGGAKAAGALGLLVGLAVPAIGIAAAAGLTLYFAMAIGTVVRARCWHQYYPVPFFLLALAALVLGLAA